MASQQINEAHEKASQQIRNIESKANEDIASVRRQASEEMTRLKSQYSSVDKQMYELEQKLKQEKERSKQLQKELRNELEQKLEQEKLRTKQLQKEVKALKQAKDNVSTPHVNTDCNNNLHQGFDNKRSSILSSTLPFLNTLIIVGVASFLIWKTPSDNSQELTKISTNIAEIKDQISGKKAQEIETRKQDKENVTSKLSNAQIYITDANYLSPGAPSKVVVKDASGKPVKNGKWTTSDKEASVEDNHDGTALITATKSGTMEITYTVGSDKTTKTVTVKKV